MTKVKLVMLGMLVVACSTKSASEYKTSEIMANFSATATGNGSTTVSGTLGDPTNLLTFLQLTADDKLTASQGSDSKEMKETSLLGLVTYDASFGKDAADTLFHIKLARSLDGGAPDSTTSLPQPFNLTPLAKAEFSRAEAMTVSWYGDASADKMTLKVSGTCLDGYDTDVPAGATTFTIPANTLKKHAPSDSTEKVPDTCDAAISVSRSRSGTVDKAFKGGSFIASQTRSLDFKTKL